MKNKRQVPYPLATVGDILVADTWYYNYRKGVPVKSISQVQVYYSRFSQGAWHYKASPAFEPSNNTDPKRQIFYVEEHHIIYNLSRENKHD